MAIVFGKQVRHCLLCYFILWALLLTGCYTKYPYEYGSSSRWVSESPRFILEYRETLDGPYRLEAQEYFEVNGERYPVFVGYQSNIFDVYPADATTHNPDDLIFRGRWEIRGNQMVVIIDEDNFFDGIYEKIYFTYEEIEP